MLSNRSYCSRSHSWSQFSSMTASISTKTIFAAACSEVLPLNSGFELTRPPFLAWLIEKSAISRFAFSSRSLSPCSLAAWLAALVPSPRRRYFFLPRASSLRRRRSASAISSAKRAASSSTWRRRASSSSIATLRAVSACKPLLKASSARRRASSSIALRLAASSSWARFRSASSSSALLLADSSSAARRRASSSARRRASSSAARFRASSSARRRASSSAAFLLASSSARRRASIAALFVVRHHKQLSACSRNKLSASLLYSSKSRRSAPLRGRGVMGPAPGSRHRRQRFVASFFVMVSSSRMFCSPHECFFRQVF
mmetsp:Transcript_82/g.153  ORF Transcript_82/g.153 Transcript_82/m.153 type:complete len:317 (+) Transcript_82:1542-2492(+)